MKPLIPLILALPSVLYMLPGVDTDLFTEAFVSRYNPQAAAVRADGSCSFAKRLPRVVTVSDPTDGDSVYFQLVDLETFDDIQRDTLTLRVAQNDLLADLPTVTAQIIGDSFVQGAFFRDALVDSAYVPSLRLVGMREVTDGNGACDEGRGGWTLEHYFTIPKAPDAPYHGFMHPQGDMRYLGATGFWMNVHRVASGELSDFESRYQCGRFGRYASRFRPADGYPVIPQKGDVMWDTAREVYVRYDGKRWQQVKDMDEQTWTFDYGKYLATWDIEAPQFLFETLGLNDWRYGLDADYSQWDDRLRTLKESYLQAVPSGTFAIVIPCSTCGTPENRRGDFTTLQNAAMWRFRKHLVDTFDHREDEGYHIVDMGITIDNENGYRRDADGLQVGNPHPYPNYPTMGRPLAAFINWHRCH